LKRLLKTIKSENKIKIAEKEIEKIWFQSGFGGVGLAQWMFSIGQHPRTRPMKITDMHKSFRYF